MGQQQLLLLVLGTIIVGVAIMVGMNVFSSGAVQANKDAVIQDNMIIASRIVNFSRKPFQMGGGFNTLTGERSFTDSQGNDCTLTDINWLATNANGSYALSASGASATITSTGHETGVTATTEVDISTDPPTITTN